MFSNLLKQSWLSFGKFRLNWAQVGNGAPDQALADTYAKFATFNGNGLFSVNSIKNNPNLRPTVTSSYEVGLEMSMFNKRVGFDVSYYRSLSEDQIFRVPYSEATGYSSRYVNAGSIENKGVELQLNGTPVASE